MADAVQLAESYDRMAVIRCVEQSLSWVNELPCWPLFAFQRHSICVADDVSSVVQRRLANSALKCHGTHVLSRCGGAVVADAAREHVGCVVCGPCSGSLRMSEFNLNAPFGSTWCFFPLDASPVCGFICWINASGTLRATGDVVLHSPYAEIWMFVVRVQRCRCDRR